MSPAAEVWPGGCGSHLIFLSLISCISRHLNELAGPKFLFQRVQILGPSECFLFAVLAVPPSVPLQGKARSKSLSPILGYSLFSAAKATFPHWAEGDFQEAPKSLPSTKSLSFLSQFISGLKSHSVRGNNLRSLLIWVLTPTESNKSTV